MFIDDFLIIARGQANELLRNRIQSTLNNVRKWSDENGLIFSTDPSKSVCINFTRTRNNRFPSLFYNDTELKFVDHIKFLGLYWDRNLNWSLHIKNLKIKSMAALNALKMVSNKKYGVQRANLITFYKSYVLPLIDYGCVIYGSAKDHILEKLNPVHNASIRIATGPFEQVRCAVSMLSQ